MLHRLLQLLLLVGACSGFTIDTEHRWPNPDVALRVEVDDHMRAFVPYIQAAASSWELPGTKLRIDCCHLEGAPPPLQQLFGAVVMGGATPTLRNTVRHGVLATATRLGQTTTSSLGDTIVSFDITVNLKRLDSVLQLQQVLLHEFGHVHGLKHSNVSGAVMTSTLQPTLQLHPDDVIARYEIERRLYGYSDPCCTASLQILGGTVAVLPTTHRGL